MPAWGTDISSAYLLAKTSEKVCIIAGPEFGDKAGELLIVDKALYGLCTSCKMWAQLLCDILYNMGFEKSFADPSIFMRKCKTRDVYEYVAVYVDDLCFVVAEPEQFLEDLKNNPIKKVELKGSE